MLFSIPKRNYPHSFISLLSLIFFFFFNRNILKIQTPTHPNTPNPRLLKYQMIKSSNVKNIKSKIETKKITYKPKIPNKYPSPNPTKSKESKPQSSNLIHIQYKQKCLKSKDLSNQLRYFIMQRAWSRSRGKKESLLECGDPRSVIDCGEEKIWT